MSTLRSSLSRSLQLIVIPAKAGIQRFFEVLDSGSRYLDDRVGRNDV